MKTLVYVVGGLVVGLAAGWSLGTRFHDHWYRVEHEVTLLDKAGARLGVVPAGSVLLSNRRLNPNGELGWWGYVPVYFGTEAEAGRFVKPSSTGLTSVTQITLNGASRDEEVRRQ